MFHKKQPKKIKIVNKKSNKKKTLCIRTTCNFTLDSVLLHKDEHAFSMQSCACYECMIYTDIHTYIYIDIHIYIYI